MRTNILCASYMFPTFKHTKLQLDELKKITNCASVQLSKLVSAC
jgi:hypothetical protein